jgi:hypothetical protein
MINTENEAAGEARNKVLSVQRRDALGAAGSFGNAQFANKPLSHLSRVQTSF